MYDPQVAVLVTYKIKILGKVQIDANAFVQKITLCLLLLAL